MLKIIIYALNLKEKNFECFTSKPNAHGTLGNLHIKINLKINISERGRRVTGISGSLIWSKTLMELLFNPCGEFR